MSTQRTGNFSCAIYKKLCSVFVVFYVLNSPVLRPCDVLSYLWRLNLDLVDRLMKSLLKIQ